MSHGLFLKWTLWYSMVKLIQEGLPGRVAAAKSEELDLTSSQVNFATDEAMRPMPVDPEDVPQDRYIPLFGRSSQVDDLAVDRLPEIQAEAFRPWLSSGQTILAGGVLATEGVDESTRNLAQIRQAGVVEPMPDSLLPSTVEVLDLGLEACLSRRGEDRGDSQKQAEPHDPTEDIGVLMGPLKSGIVVELGVSRSAVFSPVAQQACERRSGRHLGLLGPSLSEMPMEGNGRQDVDQGSVLNAEIFDQVEGVDFGLGGCDIGQIPALGGCRTALSSLPVDGSPAFKDTRDGSIGREIVAASVGQFLADGSGAVLAQSAMESQVASEVQNEVLQSGRGAASMEGPGGSVRQIHPIEALACSILDPPLDGGLADMELSGYDSHRKTFPDGADDGSSLLCHDRLLFIDSSPETSFFGLCYTRCPRQVSRRLWHFTVPQVLTLGLLAVSQERTADSFFRP